MTKAAKIYNSILGIIAIACIGYVVVGLGPIAWASYSAQQDRNANMHGDREARLKAGEESTFMTVCPRYAAASKWERIWNLGAYSWCEDYLHRLPEADK